MIFFIVNPASKSGKGIKIWHEVKPYLKEMGLEYKAYKTSPEKSTIYYVKNIIEKYSKGQLKIFILGGDGTINEALQGIPEDEFDRVLLGYIPTGSSNDLARALGYNKDYIKTLKTLVMSDNYRSMDLGLVEYNPKETLGYTNRKFIVSTGIGYDAAVCEEANNSPWKKTLNKLKLGKLSYFTVCLKQLYSASKTAARITLWDEPERTDSTDKTDKTDRRIVALDECYFVTAMNHCYQGGGIKFCPDAVDNDGYLDILYAHNLSKLGVLYTLPFAFSGKHIGMKGIGNTRCKSLKVEFEEPLWVHTDGEVKTKASEIRISCLPLKLKFII